MLVVPPTELPILTLEELDEPELVPILVVLVSPPPINVALLILTVALELVEVFPIFNVEEVFPILNAAAVEVMSPPFTARSPDSVRPVNVGLEVVLILCGKLKVTEPVEADATTWLAVPVIEVTPVFEKDVPVRSKPVPAV
jgi:hypothetical protein